MDIKKRLLSDNSVKPFPNSEWVDVSGVPVGATVMDSTDDIAKQSVQCFKNDGTDFIDCGRPSWISKLDHTVNSYTANVLCNDIAKESGVVIGIRSNVESGQFVIISKYADTDGNYGIRVAGDSIAFIRPAGSAQFLITVKVTPSMFYVFFNGELKGSSAVGTDPISTANLIFGARSGGTLNNEGNISFASFYEGVGDTSNASIQGLSLIDQYDFTDKSLWDGGAAGESLNGEVFTVTDGIPTTAHSTDLIPIEYLPYKSRAGYYSRNVAVMEIIDNIDFKLMIGEDFDLEVNGFYWYGESTTWLFNQYVVGDPNRFRIELSLANKKLSVQIGGEAYSFNILIMPNTLYKSIRFKKVGGVVTLTVDGEVATSGDYFTNTLMQTTSLRYMYVSGGPTASKQYVCGLVVNGESFSMNQSSGPTVTGSNGTVVNANGVFWGNRIVPLGV